MLVPFVIDADSFASDPDWTSAQQRACYKNLLDVWQRIGLLAYDGENPDKSIFYQSSQKLPQKVRTLWLEWLEHAPLLAIPGWDGIVSMSRLESFATTAQLAFVDDVRAEVEFGFCDDCDEAQRQVNGTEISICRVLAANQAQFFQDAIALSGTHIEIGDTFQETWDRRFSALAKAPIKLINIVDRYAIGQHMICPQTKRSGLERFIVLLDANASGPRHVTIYSAWTSELSGENRKTIDDIEAEMSLIFRRLPQKNVRRIKVCMAPNVSFRDDGHDRFFRFGKYVWDVGLGLKVFDGAYATERSSAGFKTGLSVAGYKQVEDDIARNAALKTCEIK